MKINQLKAGSMLSYLQMALNILISIVYTPTMIRLLGDSEYGLYNTVISTISMLAVLNLGFSGSYVRFFMPYHTKGDRKGEYSLNGLYLTVFTVIGLVALLCGIFLSFNLSLVFDEGLTAKEYSLARMLMLLLTVNMAISFPMSVFSSIVTAHERYVYLKLVACLKTVFSPLLMMAVLLLGFRSVAMVVVTIVINLIADVFYIAYALCKLKVRFVFSRTGFALFGTIFSYSGFIAINLIVDQINNNVDKVIIGRYLGTAAVTVFAVGFTLYNSFFSFSSAVSSVFVPKVHKIVNLVEDEKQQNEMLTDLFIRVGRIQFYILSLIASGFVFFGRPFVKFWSGIEDYTTAYIVALLLIIPAMIPLCQNLGIEIQRAKNLQKFRAVAYLIMAGVNIVMAAVLCQKYGIIGATLGTPISLLVANGFIINIYYHKKVGLNVLRYWKNILRISVGLIPPALYGIFVMLKIKMGSYVDILKFALPYVLIYAVSMWILSMNQGEKQLITSVFKKFKR